jgi:ParB family transcriptional regulator, chromosome partitioning protein
MQTQTLTKKPNGAVPPPMPRAADELTFVPVLEIADNPRNPRRRASAAELAELGDSVRLHGVLEPLIVRHAGPGGAVPLYEVVAGQRRLTAARSAGLEVVPAIVKALTDDEAFEIATVENIQRADMSPLEEAEAFATMRKRVASNAGVAARVGKTESYVFRRLKLLELDPGLQLALREDRLSLGHAELLLRLGQAQRKIAADPTNGVVWRRSPLLDYSEKWAPTREDLRPLHELEQFIRTKTFFDPADESVRHFQPELGQELEEIAEERAPVAGDDDDGHVPASLVSLSDDPMARSRLGAKATDPIPLTPSKWREVGKKACGHQRTGVIVHGGPARVLQVCTKRSCAIHWPVEKKAKHATAEAPKPAGKPQWQIDNERDEAERKAWTELRPKAMAALVAHLKAHPVKFGAALVAMAADARRVEAEWGVKLTAATAPLVLLLGSVTTHYRPGFLGDCKQVKFDLAKWEREQKKADAPAAKPSATRAKKGGRR